MKIYAIKGSKDPEEVMKVHESLCNGEGRFGWSNVETADLRQLRERFESDGWTSLKETEQKCYYDFLLNLCEDDYVVYVNVPVWGKCTLARVTGPYEWRWEDVDFNHRFPVDKASVQSFDRNLEIVPAMLRTRLKLQGAWWQVYAKEEFKELLSRLSEADGAVRSSWETNLRELSEKARPLLQEFAQHIHRTHQGKELEVLMEKVFRRLPGVRSVERQQGRADHGADLLVDFEFVPTIPGLVQRQTLAVQVKSYTGLHEDVGAIEDLRRAFEYYETEEDRPIHMGLVVSTADKAGDSLLQASDKLTEESGKPVSLLVGSDLVEFFLQNGADLVRAR